MPDLRRYTWYLNRLNKVKVICVCYFQRSGNLQGSSLFRYWFTLNCGDQFICLALFLILIVVYFYALLKWDAILRAALLEAFSARAFYANWNVYIKPLFVNHFIQLMQLLVFFLLLAFATRVYYYTGAGSVVCEYLNNPILLNIRQRPALIPFYVFFAEVFYIWFRPTDTRSLTFYYTCVTNNRRLWVLRKNCQQLYTACDYLCDWITVTMHYGVFGFVWFFNIFLLYPFYLVYLFWHILWFYLFLYYYLTAALINTAVSFIPPTHRLRLFVRRSLAESLAINTEPFNTYFITPRNLLIFFTFLLPRISAYLVVYMMYARERFDRRRVLLAYSCVGYYRFASLPLKLFRVHAEIFVIIFNVRKQINWSEKQIVRWPSILWYGFRHDLPDALNDSYCDFLTYVNSCKIHARGVNSLRACVKREIGHFLYERSTTSSIAYRGAELKTAFRLVKVRVPSPHTALVPTIFDSNLTPVPRKGDTVCEIFTHASSLKKTGGGEFLPINTTMTSFNKPQSIFLSMCHSSQINDRPNLDGLRRENNLINKDAYRFFIARNEYQWLSTPRTSVFLLNQTLEKKELVSWDEVQASRQLDAAAARYLGGELQQMEAELFISLRNVTRHYDINFCELERTARSCLLEIGAMPLQNALRFAVECAAIEERWPAERLHAESTRILLPNDSDFHEWFR